MQEIKRALFYVVGTNNLNGVMSNNVGSFKVVFDIFIYYKFVQMRHNAISRLITVYGMTNRDYVRIQTVFIMDQVILLFVCMPQDMMVTRHVLGIIINVRNVNEFEFFVYFKII